MLAACDCEGFMTECCDVILREEDGTIDTELFLEWVRVKLCPLLGRYDRFESRSVVVLDNASIHHDNRVVDAIEATGALVMYTAPYSPDLNPIEWMFAQYKKAILRNNQLDWVQAHVIALHSITRQNARAYFRRCGVPGAENFVDQVEGNNNRKRKRKAAIALLLVCQIKMFSMIQTKRKQQQANQK